MTTNRGTHILTLLTALLLAPLHGAEFHIAPGDKVLPKAIEAARQTPGPHTILLAPGRYFNDSAIVLDERDSGLTIKGEQPGAVAEIHGGVPIAGWERWKGGIWRAPVPPGRRFFNLIVDGQPATMAQRPKAGSGFGGGARKLNDAAVSVPLDWRDYDYTDAQVFTFIGGNWFSEMREVLDAKPDAGGKLKVDAGQSAQFGGMNNRFFLRGVLEFLDEPGEWCLKHKEGYVYYWPKDGTPADHLIVRPTAERLFDIHGRTPQTPAKEVTLANLSLVGSDFCARWYLFPPGQSGSTPEPLQQGLVFGENVDGLTVSGCKILAAGHSGVWLNKFARGCAVKNCLITGAGFAGVYANGFTPGGGPFTSGLESYVNKGHRIENNFIYDCGKVVGGGCGIQFYQAGDSLITHNEIGQMPRYGISFKGERWGSISKKMYGHDVTFDTHFDYLHTRNLKVIGNEIYSVCRNSFDFGGIESWGPGRDNLWANNDLHDIDQTLGWDGWAHVLFADDASHYLTLRNNILHHCNGGQATGGVMIKSIGQVFENNLLVDCNIGRGVTWQAYVEPGGNYTIRRNVFSLKDDCPCYDVSNPVIFSGYAGVLGRLPPGIGGPKEVDFNVIAPRRSEKPNEFRDRGIDIHSVFGDARIIRARPDWEMTARDYAPAPDSPALKLGFQPIDATQIGLKPSFPFDKLAATRRPATGKIQAEDYQRMHDLHTNGGVGICNLLAGAWAKYANIDFGAGVTKAVFQLYNPTAGAGPVLPFVRHYGDTAVESVPFKGDASVETVLLWEVSRPYTKAGRSGPELFDEVFPPEADIKAGEWKPFTDPTRSRAGVRSAYGVVDLDVCNGERFENACAYARCSIYATQGRTNATMTVSCAFGVKVWLNGDLIIAENRPGTFSETKKGVIRQGWNTILVKVNQDAARWTAKAAGNGNFWFKFGTVASACGPIAYLPGLPTEERGKEYRASVSAELHLDSPQGKLIGSLTPGQDECPVEQTSGVHTLYLVFPSAHVGATVDYFRFVR